MTAFGCVPRASVCPCARCVEAKTSPSSIAWQTPTATASWPIATCRKPGSSPARNRSSTFSSKRRISSISRRKSRSRSSDRPRFVSTFAICIEFMLSPVALVEQWKVIEAATSSRAGRASSCGSRCEDAAGTRRGAARARERRPARERRQLRSRPRRRRLVAGADRATARAARRRAHPRRPGAGQGRGSSGGRGSLAQGSAPRAVGAGADVAAGGLERPLRRDRARLQRLPRARRAAARAQSIRRA